MSAAASTSGNVTFIGVPPQGVGGVVQGRRETPGSPRLLREVGIVHSPRKRPGRPPCRAADVLKGRVLARCPNCRNTFSTDRAGRQDCPVCGKPLVVPDQQPPAAPAAPPPADAPPLAGSQAAE